MGTKIFVSASTFARSGVKPLEMLKDAGFEVFVNPLKRRLVQKELIEMGKGYQGVIAGLEPYDASVLDALVGLKCVSRVGVGVDNVDSAKVKEKGISVFNTPAVVIQPVAELTIAFIFDLLRRVTLQTSLLKKGKWEKKTGNLLYGKKIGILGLGRIGKRTSELMSALGCDVYGSDIYVDKIWAQRHKVKTVTLDELLKIADIFCIHAAFSEKDPFVLNSKEIAKMKRGSFVVNTSRGKFIDEQALYDALKSGQLAGAGLDVFVDEPYKGKLVELENVVLTPHVGTLTSESRLEMEIEAAYNIINFFKK